VSPRRGEVERPLQLRILFYLDVDTTIICVLGLEAEVSDVELALMDAEVVGLNVSVDVAELVQFNHRFKHLNRQPLHLLVELHPLEAL